MSKSIEQFAFESKATVSYWIYRKPGEKWQIVRYWNGDVITTTDKTFAADMSRHLAVSLPTGSILISALAFDHGGTGHVATRIKTGHDQFSMTTDDGIANAIVGMDVNANILAFAVLRQYNESETDAFELAGDLVQEVRGNVETKEKLRKTFAKIIANKRK